MSDRQSNLSERAQGQNEGGKSDTEEISRPRLTKTRQVRDFQKLLFTEHESIEEYDECAEISEERYRNGRPRDFDEDFEEFEEDIEVPADQQQPITLATTARESSSATGYIPGESLFLSAPLLAQIKESLADPVGGVTTEVKRPKFVQGADAVECFTGEGVVDALIRLGYAKDRSQAVVIATRVYSEGFFRALQPGGFADSASKVYRFKPKSFAVMPGRTPPRSAVKASRSKVDLDPTMFSISNIIGTQNDWLNTSFGANNSSVQDMSTDE